MTDTTAPTPPDDTPTESEAPYDASTDPDSDPSQLNPREGAAAAGGAPADPQEDPDGDPDQLNPRGA